MAITEDEPSVGKGDARSGQWDEISDLKKVIEKWTCSKVTLDQLLSEQIPSNIVKTLGGKGRRKENNSKEVIFTKADVSTSESAPMITSDSEDNMKIRDHLRKFNKKVDDGFFLGYSSAAKAFRVFNIRRQEMEETFHVTFNEDDEILGGKFVCWSAKKQTSVAMSLAEAEYVVAAGCCAQVLWIKSQLAD
nr:retrovirus-related Pol polyprotein from transposon TNT 1-94 [Tanacetum cinerariifolium]GEZ37124.1 retrovirus-related Pol polyprotein from transposon TNT 1-94 [Tanacetum cinerariifolium]